MKKINFLFAIHNHQPVGNFDHVFEESFARCYIPFLEVLDKHPGIRISLHSSGPLWDWAQERNAKYIDLVGEMALRGQIELLGGGYYEPLLSILPECDVLGQIEMMNSFLKRTFGQDPKGFWLTERVWEPHLPFILSKTGMKYTITDDSHFRLSGVTDEHITDYYVTEKYGAPLYIFPISKPLRYFIPFKMPHETIDLLMKLADERPISLTYADDGEKFGLWPDTYKWVYEEKYLHNLFDKIENSSPVISMPTFSQYIESKEPKDRIYLPTASYEEMMEWALPAKAAARYKMLSREIAGQNKRDDYSPFFRGGIWNNFFSKYPESNLMYRRMLAVSKRLEKTAQNNGHPKQITAALKHLYKAQCNCAYWHGLFGGLYLNYLRHAVYSNLISAGNLLDNIEHSGHKNWCNISRERLFDKKEEEIIVETRHFDAVISPSIGASLIELDYKPKSFNLSNVIARREESYHQGIKEACLDPDRDSDSPKSIHEISAVKDKSVVDKIIFDDYGKYSFIEHFWPRDTGIDDIRRNIQKELKDPVLHPYSVESLSFKEGRKDYLCRFFSDSVLKNSNRLALTKSYLVKTASPELSASYTVSNRAQTSADILFAVEFNLTLLAGKDPKRYYLFEGDGDANKYNLSSSLGKRDVESVSLVDEWSNFKIELKSSQRSALWVLPLETVSQSESGFELTYQGSTIFFVYDLKLLESQEKEVQLTLKVSDL